ncbi:MAG: hypothetical protein GWM90_33820 [Gemmatimonadetes bacterium]|nr:hypothetical protein [Gemmatimonadota bacterium]NIQ60314.1 hypothetical protein [Gemmatimonadota bacterium]NIU80532.1 hypothetical protein [Gammaproteobacteria bacterium]NIX48854.1 hypothetical protein [Gemmatimonadota bacterium]
MRAAERSRPGGSAWAREHEDYPGEAVLRDLQAADPASVPVIIVARFAVARAAWLEWTGQLVDPERRAALAYLAAAPSAGDGLRSVLDALGGPALPLRDALDRAGSDAEDRGHRAGAVALLGMAYHLALAVGAGREAERTARRLARITADGAAWRASGGWQRRAAALRRSRADPA